MENETLVITHDKYYKFLQKVGIRTTPKQLLRFLPYLPDVNVEKIYYNNPRVRFTHEVIPRKKHETIILFHRVITPRNNTNDLLKKIRKQCKNLIYFDIGDSIGTIHRKALELCDVYWKKQAYKDKTNYLKDLYLDNEYADKFSKKENTQTHIKEDHLKKIRVAWNLGMADHYLYTNNTQKVLRRFGFSYDYPSFTEPDAERKYDVNIRMKTTGYPKTFVERHRKKLLKEISPGFNTTPADTVSKKEYLDELANSKIVISPFGNGAVCYRDFEAVIAGATLVKPDVSHIETWPDIYEKNKTYVPVSWTFEDINEKVNDLLENEEKRKRIAKNAQKKYKDYHGEKGIKKLKNRFEKLLTSDS